MISDCHILKVESFDIGNGPGIRVTVWVAGCNHHCDGCHNPQTWKWVNNGKPLTQALIEKILNICDKEYIQGLTLSGGDPLFIKNRDGVLELCKQFKLRFGSAKSIWLWTGYKYEEVKDLPVMEYIDTLIDGKFIKELKDPSLIYAGSKNQKIIHIH